MTDDAPDALMMIFIVAADKKTVVERFPRCPASTAREKFENLRLAPGQTAFLYTWQAMQVAVREYQVPPPSARQRFCRMLGFGAPRAVERA